MQDVNVRRQHSWLESTVAVGVMGCGTLRFRWLGGVGCATTANSTVHLQSSIFLFHILPAATANMSGGFFGFDTALPEHRQAADRPNDAADTSKFQNASSLLNPFNLEAPEDEEMEVYTWGQGLDKDVEAADELNDATFGVDVNAISE